VLRFAIYHSRFTIYTIFVRLRRNSTAIFEWVMQEDKAKSRPVHENLDTAYVNLAALVRYLRQREFDGRIRVELDEYEADVFLSASEPPRVIEMNHMTGRSAEGEAALQRLFVRASEPGGLVSVYETSVEEMPEERAGVPYQWAAAITEERAEEELTNKPPQEADGWSELVRLSGELIGTVERAALSTGADFQSLFRDVRLSLADDFSFLDPATGRFEYGNGAVELRARPGENAYVSGIAEALRRVVNKISTGPRAQSVRERVALELAVLARRRQSQLTHFKLAPQLNRIAGTRVL
jgi:hypothetical protein